MNVTGETRDGLEASGTSPGDHANMKSGVPPELHDEQLEIWANSEDDNAISAGLVAAKVAVGIVFLALLYLFCYYIVHPKFVQWQKNKRKEQVLRPRGAANSGTGSV